MRNSKVDSDHSACWTYVELGETNPAQHDRILNSELASPLTVGLVIKPSRGDSRRIVRFLMRHVLVLALPSPVGSNSTVSKIRSGPSTAVNLHLNINGATIDVINAQLRKGSDLQSQRPILDENT